MISYIRGVLAEKNASGFIIVEAGQVGFGIRVPLSCMAGLPQTGSEVKIFTYLQVQEDDMSLYGFLNQQELEMFKQLLAVNGIGPKGALAILSALPPEKLRLAVISGDAKAISSAQGIGAKTAQRVILELKDKIKPEDVLLPDAAISREEGGEGLPAGARDAADALAALGYSPAEALRAVRKVNDAADKDTEEILREALRFLL